MNRLLHNKEAHFLGMIFFYTTILASALLFFLLMPQALAHSPLTSGDNESLAKATLIPDPMKSWVIYSELDEGGEAQYYQFNMTKGKTIHIMLMKSANTEDRNFAPVFVLMGPGINANGSVPSYVQVSSGAGAIVVEGKQQPLKATYEPFSPSVFYSLADLVLDAPSSGTYYIAVYEPFAAGHYGLAIGDVESYTLIEWILMPLNQISVYQWEGESLIFIFAPMIATLEIGAGLLIWTQRSMATPKAMLNWLVAVAGLLFVGTGLLALVQMALALTRASLVSEVLITVVFALIALLLGFFALSLSSKTKERMSLRKRAFLAILGMVALFAWAGLLIGPILAIIASVLPYRITPRKS